MQTIKKYWKLFIGGLVAVLGIGLITHFYKNNIIKFFKGKTNVTTPTKDVVDHAQDQATEVIDTAEQKIDTAEQTKTQVKKRIHKKKKKIQDLEDKKKNVPVVDRTLSEAKQNIIKKTKRK